MMSVPTGCSEEYSWPSDIEMEKLGPKVVDVVDPNLTCVKLHNI